MRCFNFLGLVLLGAVLPAFSGCSSLASSLHGPDAVPARKVPGLVMTRPRSDMQEISLSRLRQTPPQHYQLGPNDILGVTIESVMGKAGEAPIVHFPENGKRDPSIGYPIPIREDGTIALPLIRPMKVEGLTVEQVACVSRDIPCVFHVPSGAPGQPTPRSRGHGDSFQKPSARRFSAMAASSVAALRENWRTNGATVLLLENLRK